MTTQEQTYKVTVHLIDGTKHKVSTPLTAYEVGEIYRVLGMERGRLKYPTAPNTQQYMPISSVLRIEAVGVFE